MIFTLSSKSIGLLLWSANHTLIDWNSALVVFNIVNEWDAIVTNWPNYTSGKKVNKTLDACDNCYWLNQNVLKIPQQILILVHLHCLYLDQLPNKFIVSGDNNSNL